MSKPIAFIMVEGGQTWIRTTAETEEAIRTGFIMETVPLYTDPPKREPLTCKLISLGNNCHKYFLEGVKFAEKMHGIGVDDE